MTCPIAHYITYVIRFSSPDDDDSHGRERVTQMSNQIEKL